MVDFKYQLQKTKEKYQEEIKSIKYWEKIYKFFEKMSKKNVETFTKEFKHSSNIFSNFQPDNEAKIEGFAKEFNYIIIDEQIISIKSIYSFKKDNL